MQHSPVPSGPIGPTRRRALGLIGSGLVGTTWAGSSIAQVSQELPRVIMTETPPWAVVGEDGRISGIGHDIIKAAVDESGAAFEITALPTARLVPTLQAGRCAAAVLMNAHLVPGIRRLVEVVAVPIVAVSRDRVPLTMGRLLTLRIGAARGIAYGGPLADLPPDQLVEVRSLEEVVRLLAGGRVDAIIGTSVGIQMEARHLGVEEQLGSRLLVATAHMELAGPDGVPPDPAVDRLVEGIRRIRVKDIPTRIIDAAAGRAWRTTS